MCVMSNVERKEIQAAIQRVQEEINRLSEQQTAAEKIAALVGMTTDDSRQYRNGIAGSRG
jgi:hypothetical protein